MIKRFVYIILIISAIVACEEIYNPKLDVVDDFLGVEAILISNHVQNEIHLYKSIGFNQETETYPKVSGALVYLVDENNNQIKCEESEPGTYQLNYEFDPNGAYYLYIEYDGEKYQSKVQAVPEVPNFDSIYVGYTTKVTTLGISNSTENIIEEDGIQIYVDMNYKGGLNHYRFSSRKVVQYKSYYDSMVPPSPFPVAFPEYHWNSYYPQGTFNIAGPSEYSSVKNITKHPLDFFEKELNKFMPDTAVPCGFIYFIYQYGLNEDTYNFYSEVNDQLDAEGKIFDPVYIQAEGNITCSSNPEKLVIGNFEISSFAEKRYYLLYYSTWDTIKAFRSIPYFYDIPERGDIKNIEPDFWESKLENDPE